MGLAAGAEEALVLFPASLTGLLLGGHHMEECGIRT
jgi:hypothetical protein